MNTTPESEKLPERLPNDIDVQDFLLTARSHPKAFQEKIDIITANLKAVRDIVLPDPELQNAFRAVEEGDRDTKAKIRADNMEWVEKATGRRYQDVENDLNRLYSLEKDLITLTGRVTPGSKWHSHAAELELKQGEKPEVLGHIEKQIAAMQAPPFSPISNLLQEALEACTGNKARATLGKLAAEANNPGGMKQGYGR